MLCHLNHLLGHKENQFWLKNHQLAKTDVLEPSNQAKGDKSVKNKDKDVEDYRELRQRCKIIQK